MVLQHIPTRLRGGDDKVHTYTGLFRKDQGQKSAQATLRLFFGVPLSAGTAGSSSFFMEDLLAARGFGLALTLAARRVVVVEALLEDRSFRGSVERVLSTAFPVSALRFDRPRTLPVALAAS